MARAASALVGASDLRLLNIPVVTSLSFKVVFSLKGFLTFSKLSDIDSPFSFVVLALLGIHGSTLAAVLQTMATGILGKCVPRVADFCSPLFLGRCHKFPSPRTSHST